MNRNTCLSFFAMFTFAACGTGGGTMDAGSGVDTTCDATPTHVTMAQLQTDIFEPVCKSCHYPATGGMAEGSGFAYGDYTSLDKTYEMAVGPDGKGKFSVYKGSAGTLRIVDRDTSKSTGERLANSSLWLKVSPKSPQTTAFKGPHGEATGVTMPQGGPFLTAAQVKEFKDFICSGADKM